MIRLGLIRTGNSSGRKLVRHSGKTCPRCCPARRKRRRAGGNWSACRERFSRCPSRGARSTPQRVRATRTVLRPRAGETPSSRSGRRAGCEAGSQTWGASPFGRPCTITRCRPRRDAGRSKGRCSRGCTSLDFLGNGEGVFESTPDTAHFAVVNAGEVAFVNASHRFLDQCKPALLVQALDCVSDLANHLQSWGLDGTPAFQLERSKQA